jgi:hypothetical protein
VRICRPQGRLLVCLVVAGWCVVSSPVGAQLKIQTEPTPVVLGKTESVSITVRGLPGTGPVVAAANIGVVIQADVSGTEVKLRYTPPEKDFPQILCLALWRKGRPREVHVARVPMDGRRRITIRTRRNSNIVITVGRRVFGPYETGSRRRRKVRLIISPGVTKAVVKVTDKVGLKTTKRIRIKPPPYNLLTLALSSKQASKVQITLATARPQTAGTPSLRVGQADVPLSSKGPGIWSAEVDTARLGAAGAALAVKAWLPDQAESVRLDELRVASPRAPAGAVAAKPGPGSSGSSAPDGASGGRLRGVIGVGVGLVHNTGAFFSPRFSFEAGLDYRLPVGWLGLRLLAGVSWASQQISGVPGLTEAESDVLVVPLGGGLSYALPLKLLTPYATVGLFAQLVHSSSTAEGMAEQSSDDVVFGVQGTLGAQRRLGPGAIFLQAGFAWGQVETPGLELLAGGVVLEAGYRLLL